MPTLPTISVSFDPGVSVVPGQQNAYRRVCVVGVSEKGDTTLQRFTNTSEAETEYGQGPMIGLLKRLLYQLRQPVYAVRANSSVAGAIGATKYAQSLEGTMEDMPTDRGVATFGGTPNDNYDPLVEIVDAGAIGTATFRYSLDGGLTFVEKMPTVTSYSIPNTGIDVTFDTTNGDFVAENVFWASATAPQMNVADMQAALNVAAIQPDEKFGLVAVAQGWDETDIDTALATAEAQALEAESHINLWTVLLSFRRQNEDETDANWRNAALGTTYAGGTRVMRVFGEGTFFDPTSNRRPRLLLLEQIIPILVEADLTQAAMQIRLGAIPYAEEMAYVAEQDDQLYADKWVIARNWDGFPGWYVAGGLLATEPNSNLIFLWQRRAIDAVQERLQRFAPYVVGQLAQESLTEAGKLTDESAEFWALQFKNQTLDLIDGQAIVDVQISCANSTVVEQVATLVVDWEIRLGVTVGSVTINGTIMVSN